MVGNNLREHLDDVKRNRALNRCCATSSCRSVRATSGPAARRPGRARHLRALEFRTLLPRVFDALGGEGGIVEESKPTATAPAPARLDADALAAWAEAATARSG